MSAITQVDTSAAVAAFIRFLETNEAPEGLLAPDVFADLTFPHWRIQTTTADDLIAIRHGRPPGAVRVERVDPTGRGFLIQLEERWQDGEQWYARELFRADLEADRIVELAGYCPGNWDEEAQRKHAAKITLVRP